MFVSVVVLVRTLVVVAVVVIVEVVVVVEGGKAVDIDWLRTLPGEYLPKEEVCVVLQQIEITSL